MSALDIAALPDWLIQHRNEMVMTAMLASLIGIGLVEVLWPRLRHGREFEARWLGHVGIVVCNLVLIELTIGDAIFRADMKTQTWLPVSALVGEHPLVTIVVGVLIADFLRYCIHRVNHGVPWLWRLHALHHSDPTPDVTTSFRHHPFEHFLLTATVWIAHVVFGASAAALVVYGVISSVMSPLQHANLRLPRWLDVAVGWVLVSNALHLSHHSTDRRDGNANFGVMFSFWDRIFGTYRAPLDMRDGSIRFGVDEIPPAACRTFVQMLSLPWRRTTRPVDA